MKRGMTLVEVLVAVAIFATLVSFLAVGCSPTQHDAEGRPVPVSPQTTIQMVTVKHDGHWWILCRSTFAHHPDCPCRHRRSEQEP